MAALFVVLIPILLTIEGSNRDVVPDGDGGRAVGCLQIHEIYVREVNRILGDTRYTYADRKDKKKSIEMAKIHISYWAFDKMNGTLLENLIILGRIHNGGANGEKKDSTLDYKDKIIKYYNERK